MHIPDLRPAVYSRPGKVFRKGCGRRTKIIHWAPADGPRVRVLRPDGMDEGVGEAGIAQEQGRVVQFERYGFVQINSVGGPIVAYFAHR